MKAVSISQPRCLSVLDVPVPTLERDTDVKLRIISGGICGSDIGIYKGTNALATYPRIIGHEYCGEVVEIGSTVTGVKPGDIAAVDPVISCGVCRACRRGHHNVCERLEVTGVHRDGGFKEYVVVPQSNVYPMRDVSFPRELLCMAEPFTIGMEANDRAQTAYGDRVVIFGSGPIGLCCLQVAKMKGAEVLITSHGGKRMALAKRCGADAVIDTRSESLEDAVGDFCHGEGADVIIDTVCTPASFADAVRYSAPACRVVVLGLTTEPLDLAQVSITKKELSILGSRLNNYKFDAVIKAFAEKKLDPDALVTHRFAAVDAQKAIDLSLSHDPEVCKIMLTF